MIIETERHKGTYGESIIRTHTGERFPYEYVQPEKFYSLELHKNGECCVSYYTDYRQALRTSHANLESR